MSAPFIARGSDMSLPYFPMYPGDFEAKTSHLSIAEDGAYNRLLRICWMSPGCSIPNDEAWIFRRVRAHSEEDKVAVRAVLAEFFTEKAGRLANPRLAREWLAANEAHAKRVSAGSRGGVAKARNAKEKKPSKAKAMLWQPEPEPEPYKEDTSYEVSTPRKRADTPNRSHRLSADWTLPDELREWAIAQGWPPPLIEHEAERMRDWSLSSPNGAKRDWAAAWRNWMRDKPKLSAMDGGRNGERTDKRAEKSEELQRIIAAAAAGTSRSGWG